MSTLNSQTHDISLSLSLTHTHTHISLFLSFTHTHTHSLSLSHTHTHTHISLSLSHTHTQYWMSEVAGQRSLWRPTHDGHWRHVSSPCCRPGWSHSMPLLSPDQRYIHVYTCMSVSMIYSGASDSGHSEKWTTSLEWTNCSTPQLTGSKVHVYTFTLRMHPEVHVDNEEGSTIRLI